MNDEQVNIFLQVADSGSFTKAEANSFLSKQAMLKQLNHLEEEVGCKLLERGRGGTRLTEAGQLFYEGIKDLQDRREKLLTACRHAAGQSR